MSAYEDCFNNTSTPWAPWYVIPADYKPFTRLCVAFLTYRALKQLNLHYPEVSKLQRAELVKAKRLLQSE